MFEKFQVWISSGYNSKKTLKKSGTLRLKIVFLFNDEFILETIPHVLKMQKKMQMQILSYIWLSLDTSSDIMKFRQFWVNF